VSEMYDHVKMSLLLVNLYCKFFLSSFNRFILVLMI